MHRGYESATILFSMGFFCVPEESEVYLVRIFTCDTCCDYMAPWGGRCRQSLKVDGRVSPGLDAIKHSDVFHPLKRNTHSNLTEDSGISATQVNAQELTYIEHKVTGSQAFNNHGFNL